MKSFEGSGILVTRLLKIEEQYEFLVKPIEMMESASTPLKKRCKQPKNLTLKKILVALTITLQQKCKTMTLLKQ